MHAWPNLHIHLICIIRASAFDKRNKRCECIVMLRVRSDASRKEMYLCPSAMNTHFQLSNEWNTQCLGWKTRAFISKHGRDCAQAIRNLPHGNSFGYSRHTGRILLMQKPNKRHTPFAAYSAHTGKTLIKQAWIRGIICMLLIQQIPIYWISSITIISKTQWKN